VYLPGVSFSRGTLNLTGTAFELEFNPSAIEAPGAPRRGRAGEDRSGYFASKEFRQFSPSDRERQLQEALMLGDPVTDLTLALEVNYFRLAKDRYFVPVSVKIPGTDIELARKGGAEKNCCATP
jgi:hypothetical protein